MKFNEAAKQRLKYIKIANTPATYKYSKGYLTRSCDYLGDMDCEEIDRNTLLDFITYRREIKPDITNATINKYLKHIIATLKEECDIKVKFKLLKEEKKLPQLLTRKTISKVYKYCDQLESDEGRRNRLMFMMLLDTGLRISELLSVKVDDIDFDNKMIFVKKTKTHQQRYALFTDDTLEFLEKYILLCNIKDHLFINFETGNMLHPDSIQTICQRIQEKANIKQSITPHKWRHTFASRFTENNGNTFVLMKLLGHNSIKTTQRYVQVSMKKVIEEYTEIVKNDVK